MNEDLLKQVKENTESFAEKAMDITEAYNYTPPTKIVGGLSSNNGFLSSKEAYLIIESPIESRPSNYGYIKGNKLNGYISLNNIHGYTKVDEIRFNTAGSLPDGITKDELDKIRTLLKNGVIF